MRLWHLLAVAFVVVPLTEIAILLWLSSVLGPGVSFLIVVLTGVFGAWFAKREGFHVLVTLRKELSRGIPPGSRLMEGALVLVGGLLLITPGVLTDLTGFLLIFPPTRRYLAPRILAYAAKRLDIRVDLGTPRDSPPPPGKNPFSNPFDDLP